MTEKKSVLSKRGVLTIFYLLAVAMMAVIVLHHNPLADAKEELIKKLLSCAVILGGCAVFTRFYDKITTLPVELWENRHLIWKIEKNDFKTSLNFLNFVIRR